MIKKNSLLIFSLFLLTYCSTEKKNEVLSSDTLVVDTPDILTPTTNIDVNSVDSNVTFNDYLLSLDRISLPLKYNALGALPDISLEYNKFGFEKYKYTGTSRPLGILENDGDLVTLIDCSNGDWGLAPFLMTYDKYGNKIDSLGPYQKTGEGEGYYAIEYVEIINNKTIVVKDTVKEWNVEDENIPGFGEQNKKITTHQITYRIDNSGMFKKDKK